MLKVDYKKHWGNDGTVYRQTITVDKNIMRGFNEYVDTLKSISEMRIMKTDKDLAILGALQKINGNINYCRLTTLYYFIDFLNNYGENTSRIIKDRNTIIIVKY